MKDDEHKITISNEKLLIQNYIIDDQDVVNYFKNLQS